MFLALVVVFLGFWMFTDPDGLADSSGALWGATTQLFSAVIRFFGEL